MINQQNLLISSEYGKHHSSKHQPQQDSGGAARPGQPDQPGDPKLLQQLDPGAARQPVLAAQAANPERVHQPAQLAAPGLRRFPRAGNPGSDL